jgi:O-antigen/teichoic acid export membrane protein
MADRRRTLRAPAGQPPELAVRVGFNGLAQLAPVIVILALTPLLLDRLGLDRFGIWSLMLVLLNTLRLLDGGITASLARFFAMYAAWDDRTQAGRLLVGSLLCLALVGLALTMVAFPLAPTVVELLDIPTGLSDEATVLLRWVPALAALALMSESAAALLVGNGRFRALAGAMWTSAAAFAVAVVVLVQPGAHLDALVIASAARFVVLMASSLLLAAPHAVLKWPLLPSRATAREVVRYSSRMQVSALTGFVNTEMDALVIAAVLPVRYVGLYQIGMQVASAVRSLPLYAFAPLLTRLTTIFRLEGRAAAAAEFQRLERRWLVGVLGYGAVGVAAVAFSVPVWLGDRYVLSGVVAAVLLAGYTVHVALTGMRTCYVRAVGRPGLETRCSTMWTVVNAVLTIPLVLIAGVVGVVAATAFAGMVASVYFVSLCRRKESLPLLLPEPRWWVLAAAAVGITVVGQLAVVYSGIRGFAGLALSGVPALAGWAAVATGYRVGQLGGLRPSPSREP